MIQVVKKIGKELFFPAFLLLFTMVYETFQALKSYPDDAAAIFILFGFLSVVTFWGLKDLQKTTKIHSSPAWSWFLLVLSLSILCAEQLNWCPAWFDSVGLTGLLLALLMRFSGKESVIFLGLPIIMSIALLPNQAEILLALSFPLRLISSAVTVEFLEICGLDITRDVTTIYIAQREVAITDACSGISELWALLLFAAIFIYPLRIPRIGKICGLLLIFPVAILANILRLVLTFFLFMIMGEQVFENNMHIALGYLFLITSFLLLLGGVKLLKKGFAS
ncbi:MAG: exosortase/archaeosortase family protein [Victivallaceae bacterium]